MTVFVVCISKSSPSVAGNRKSKLKVILLYTINIGLKAVILFECYHFPFNTLDG